MEQLETLAGKENRPTPVLGRRANRQESVARAPVSSLTLGGRQQKAGLERPMGPVEDVRWLRASGCGTSPECVVDHAKSHMQPLEHRWECPEGWPPDPRG